MSSSFSFLRCYFFIVIHDFINNIILIIYNNFIPAKHNMMIK